MYLLVFNFIEWIKYNIVFNFGLGAYNINLVESQCAGNVKDEDLIDRSLGDTLLQNKIQLSHCGGWIDR